MSKVYLGQHSNLHFGLLGWRPIKWIEAKNELRLTFNKISVTRARSENFSFWVVFSASLRFNFQSMLAVQLGLSIEPPTIL